MPGPTAAGSYAVYFVAGRALRPLRERRFTANAAHELKLPLATLKTGAQVLLRNSGATLQDYRANAGVMIKSIDWLTGVTNDLFLLMSAVETRDVESEPIDLETMFETIFDDLAPLYGKQNIRAQINCGGVLLHANAPLLYRAFYNLIENACIVQRRRGLVRR